MEPAQRVVLFKKGRLNALPDDRFRDDMGRGRMTKAEARSLEEYFG